MSRWKLAVGGLAVAAALLIGGSLWWQEHWERESFSGWLPAQAEVVSASLEPQSGWTGAVGLKPVYHGRVELRFGGPADAPDAHVEFVFHSLWQVDVERLRKRLRPGASIAVLRAPGDLGRVHVPRTMDSATPAVTLAVGFVLALAAAVLELLRKARSIAKALESLWSS